MKKCKLSPDENKECSCYALNKCDVYDELVADLKKCPLKNRKRAKVKQTPVTEFRCAASFLSNFYECPITYKDKVYATAEHLFQALKTKDEDLREAIRLTRTPQLAKQLGRTVKLRRNWEGMKFVIMLMVVRIKFTDKELAKLLLKTESRPLVEGNRWHDNYWGDCWCPGCKNIKGKNQLGKILMLVRLSQRNT